MAPPKTTILVTIPAGQTVSDSADLTAYAVIGIISPPDWTPANISFLASADNTTFADLYDVTGTEVIKAMGPSWALDVDTSLTAGAVYLKLRSGPSANPIPQAADRVFTLIVQ